jgi:hypothetical protein
MKVCSCCCCRPVRVLGAERGVRAAPLWWGRQGTRRAGQGGFHRYAWEKGKQKVRKGKQTARRRRGVRTGICSFLSMFRDTVQQLPSWSSCATLPDRSLFTLYQAHHYHTNTARAHPQAVQGQAPLIPGIHPGLHPGCFLVLSDLRGLRGLHPLLLARAGPGRI